MKTRVFVPLFSHPKQMVDKPPVVTTAVHVAHLDTTLK